MTARFIKILLDFTLSPCYCKQNKEGQAASETLVSNSHPGGRAVVVHLGHVPAVRSMPTCLFSHQVLIHTSDGPQGIAEGIPLKYGKQRDTAEHTLIDFYSKHSVHMLFQGKLTRRGLVE